MNTEIMILLLAVFASTWGRHIVSRFACRLRYNRKLYGG